MRRIVKVEDARVCRHGEIPVVFLDSGQKARAFASRTSRTQPTAPGQQWPVPGVDRIALGGGGLLTDASDGRGGSRGRLPWLWLMQGPGGHVGMWEEGGEYEEKRGIFNF